MGEKRLGLLLFPSEWPGTTDTEDFCLLSRSHKNKKKKKKIRMYSYIHTYTYHLDQPFHDYLYGAVLVGATLSAISKMWCYLRYWANRGRLDSKNHFEDRFGRPKCGGLGRTLGQTIFVHVRLEVQNEKYSIPKNFTALGRLLPHSILQLSIRISSFHFPFPPLNNSIPKYSPALVKPIVCIK